MQIFNEINARKLGVKEFNVFSGFFNNPLFLLILVGTMVVQYFLVQYGGPPVRTVPLSQDQHLICIAIGAGSLIWGVIVKLFLPATLFGKIDLAPTYANHITAAVIGHAKIPMIMEAVSPPK